MPKSRPHWAAGGHPLEAGDLGGSGCRGKLFRRNRAEDLTPLVLKVLEVKWEKRSDSDEIISCLKGLRGTRGSQEESG